MHHQLWIQSESEIDAESEIDSKNETSVITQVQDVDRRRVAAACVNEERVSSDDYLCIQIDSLQWTESLPSLLSPWIRIHMCEESSGKCVYIHHENTSTGEELFQTTTVPTYQDVLLFRWEEPIVIPIPYSRFLDVSTIIFFEVLDTKMVWTFPESAFSRNEDLPQEQEQPIWLHHRKTNQSQRSLAWAFLRPRAKDGRLHVDADGHCKLQLYRFQSHIFTKHLFQSNCLKVLRNHETDLFQQYLAPTRMSVDGFIQLVVRPTINPFQHGSKSWSGERVSYHEMCPPEVMFEPSTVGTRTRGFPHDMPNGSIPLLKRDHLEPFQVVDTVHAWLPSSSLGINTHGANALSFTDCGELLASAVSSKMPSFTSVYFYQISIFLVSDGDRVMIIDSCHHDVISDLTWHLNDDNHFLLVSSSLDGTIQIHSIPPVADLVSHKTVSKLSLGCQKITDIYSLSSYKSFQSLFV